MPKIKVVHVYKDFNVYNGLIEILTILAGGIDRDRFELAVCVFRYDGNSFGEDFERKGGKICSLDIPKRPGNEMRELMGLHRYFRSFRPDIVQTHVLKSNLFGILAARKAKVPVIIGTEMTLKDIAHTPLARLRDRAIQPLVGLSLRYSDAFMVTSEFIKKQWCRKRNSGKFRVIYPPFNLEKLGAARPAPIPLAAPETQRAPTIGFIGRLSEEKGIKTLVQSMSLVRLKIARARLLIVGTGPIERQLRELVQNAHLEEAVSFLGFSANVFEPLRTFDVFVLPSRTEGCPIVVLEAMAMGVPVIATNVGGTPELIKDEVTGSLVRANDPQALANSIVRLLSDREKARELGEEGRKRAFGEFHPDRFIENVERMYLELLARRQAL